MSAKLAASMLSGKQAKSAKGHVQREGAVVHLVTHDLTDLTPLLTSISYRGAIAVAALRDLGNTYGHVDEIRVRMRDFR